MKSKIIVSAFTGFLFGWVSYFIWPLLDIGPSFQLSVACGLFFALLLLPVLIVCEKVTGKRYAEIEKEITSPVFYKTNGNFNLGNGKVKNGNVYFCESGIVCVCLDENPYTLDEILLQDIARYQFDNIHLNIFTTDGRIFVLTLPDATRIMEVLRQKGWV